MTALLSTPSACCEPDNGPAGTPAAGTRPALCAAEASARAKVLKALADPNRLRLLSMVRAGEPGGVCVCDLTEPLKLGQPTVSHHLKTLVDAGLLRRHKRGTWAYYSLVPGALTAVADSILGL